MPGKIGQLIINSPFERIVQHWAYERETQQFNLREGRRPAGYAVATEGSKAFDGPGVFIELKEVDRIPERVDAWRERGHLGATGSRNRPSPVACLAAPPRGRMPVG